MAIPLTEFLSTYDRSSVASEVALAVAKRDSLVRQFPISEWPTLPLDRYALGTPKSKESFCYQMEYASPELGSIAGGNADKHLVYWSEENANWKFESKRYQSIDRAWEAIRAGFVEALRLGAAGKFDEVDEIGALSGARVLRVKFLSLYFPDRILP